MLGVPKTYTATGFAGNFFRKVCSFPVASIASASFIVGCAKAQYNEHHANFTHNITLSYKPNQANDNPIKEEPLMGSTSALEFYYKKGNKYIDVYCQFPSYNEAAWLTVLFNSGVDFSGVFGTTSETTSTCVKCVTPFPDLTELASALGGLYVYSGWGLDADLLTTTGAYVNNNCMDNMPSIETHNKGAWGTLVHIEAQYRIQIYCGGTASAHGYWIRFRTGSAWHPWYKITGTEV